MSKLLTVSVAAYNVEATLREALDSFTDPGVAELVEVLVVDDLKPGYDMARAAGVPFAAAAWAGDYPVVAAFMQAKCERYLKTVEELAALVL